MEPQINPALEARRRRVFRLCAAAALGLTLLLIEQTTVFAETDEALGFIKGDAVVIGGQIDLGIGYLTSALSILESSGSPADVEAASALAYQAYRVMRFALWGIVVLGQKRRIANPLHEVVTDNLMQAEGLIRKARLLLDGAAKYPENDQSLSWRMEAISDLKSVLQFAEQARLLI